MTPRHLADVAMAMNCVVGLDKVAFSCESDNFTRRVNEGPISIKYHNTLECPVVAGWNCNNILSQVHMSNLTIKSFRIPKNISTISNRTDEYLLT